MTFRTRGGQSIEIPPRLMNPFKEVFFDATYFRTEPLKDRNKPWTIVDVGANMGFFSIFCNELFPQAKIHSVEPMPINHKHILNYTKNIANINVHQIALSSKNGTIDLHYDASDSVTTSATISDGGIAGLHQPDTATVTSKKFETWCEENNISAIDFLKMDCEGAEYDILYHMDPEWFKRISHIAMEVHPLKEKDCNMEGLKKFLSNLGYEVKSEHDILWASRI
jgi:FkbM family methyltransferase